MRWRGAARQWAERLACTRRNVRIDTCYHYRGFRYGGHGNNPYEDYILDYARGLEGMRERFARVIAECRPRTMAEVLGLPILTQAAWDFPWLSPRWRPAPVSDPATNPDIVCHDCPHGMLASHLNREFRWLENAYDSVKVQGYQPGRLGYIRCLEFRWGPRSSFLVLDGNHRISALHALGFAQVEVLVRRLPIVRRDEVDRWPRVRDGTYSVVQALAVFDRYFEAQNPPLGRLRPARLIADEAPEWDLHPSQNLAAITELAV